MFWRAVLVAGVCGVGVLTTGCAGAEGDGRFGVWGAARPGVGVFSDGETRAFSETAIGRELGEFVLSRNDERVSARQAVPQTASGQWPSPPRPLERRIILEHWDQD